LLQIEAKMTTAVLDQPTLVLNKNWQPVHVTTVARSLVLLWNDAARVVDPDLYVLLSWDDWTRDVPDEGAPCVRSARLRLRVPEIICLAHYDRLPSTAVTFSRRNVAKRDHYVCQYCGAQPGAESITIDHVVPRSQGGVSTWANCVAACTECNARKGDRTPEQAGMKLRRRPVRPEWKPFYATLGGQVESWAKFLKHEPAQVSA
jgi:5-methylcytosine-specific restriction endonuclease McrA